MNLTALKNQIISTFTPFDPKKIILFGSMVGKGSDEFSDIDLIVVYDTDKRFMDRLRELYMAWQIPKAVDILAYTPEEFKEMMEDNAFIFDAIAAGETIYERSD